MDMPKKSKPYDRLLLMAVISFIAMFVLMYAMVNSLADIYPNFNQVYMALLMTAAMVIVEMLLMGAMYGNKRLNGVIIAISIVVMIFSWLSIQQQTAIGDKQFLKSMIPHHSSALLMCQNASLQDPEIKALCIKIISSQKAEINQMKAALERLNK
jgi:uncharacterized protein (DUF305 family)